MIIFDLKCSRGHTFEGWFEDGDSYEDQRGKSAISCPVCNDKNIVKIPSVFAIKGAAASRRPAMNEELALNHLAHEISDYVEKSFENVGCDFAKEALKIHYGASEPRNIRGVSTKEEEKLLTDEGVQFFKIPVTPKSDPETNSGPVS
jgi:hypothetical protein